MKPRPYRSITTQLHELAQKKGIQIKYTFIKPVGFESKKFHWDTPSMDMEGEYEVQLFLYGVPNSCPATFFGSSNLPQQAKHEASIQALPFLRRIPDTKSTMQALFSSISHYNAEGYMGGRDENVISILNKCSMTQRQEMEWQMVRDDGLFNEKYTMSLKMGKYEAFGMG